MMRVRRQITVGEVDAPAIEELAGGRDRDEHRRVAVLGDADGCGSLRWSSLHLVLLVAAPVRLPRRLLLSGSPGEATATSCRTRRTRSISPTAPTVMPGR
jgi:hypothetical protein